MVKPLALVIDGATLVFALEPEIKLKFLALGRLMKSVICCRVSPLQKASHVTLL
jgi:phospholipid-transporting ATPase